MNRIAILGAGIAGLSSGWLLSEMGFDCVILEKNAYIGGLARSFKWHDFWCDFGAHRLFSKDEMVIQNLLRITPMEKHIRKSKIYLNGNFLSDPIDILELISTLSVFENLQLLWQYVVRPRNLQEDSFENYVIRRYGYFLYRYFFQPYTEKLFGLEGSNISVSWAMRKIRLANPFDKIRESSKTKFNYFYYPEQGGYGAISQALYGKLSKTVSLNSPVTKFVYTDDRIIKVIYENNNNSHILPVDFVISTLPLTITGQMLGQSIPIIYQKVDSVYLWVNQPHVTENHWMYFMDKEICINRLVEFKNLSDKNVPQNTTVLCAEVTQIIDDPISNVIKDLIKIGLIRKTDEILDTKLITEKFAYPVYTRTREAELLTATNDIQKIKNLYLLGRAANFQHLEIDDIFSLANQVVENIIREASPSFSQVNTAARIKNQKSKNPLVCAVILAHNNYEDTHECINSVLGSDYDNFKIILVDNGSSDGTPERAHEDFSNIVILENNSNLGVPAGYNVGFSYGLKNEADYILTLNNDTIIAPDMITQMVQTIESHPTTGIIMPKILYYNNNDEFWSIGSNRRIFPPAISLTDKNKNLVDIPRLIEFAPGCGLLIRSKTFKEVGLFDPGYTFWFDDWDFCERVREKGFKIQYDPKSEMWHKVSKTIGKPKSTAFWKTYGASATRFYRRHGHPAWYSLVTNLGYIIIRDLIIKRNITYTQDFFQGVFEGFRQPLGDLSRF